MLFYATQKKRRKKLVKDNLWCKLEGLLVIWDGTVEFLYGDRNDRIRSP